MRLGCTGVKNNSLNQIKTIAPLARKVRLGGGGVVCQRRRQVAVGVDLRLEIGDLLLGRGDGIGSRDETARRVLFARDRDQRLGQLRRVAGLLAVLGGPPRLLRRRALRVIRDRRLSKGG